MILYAKIAMTHIQFWIFAEHTKVDAKFTNPINEQIKCELKWTSIKGIRKLQVLGIAPTAFPWSKYGHVNLPKEPMHIFANTVKIKCNFIDILHSLIAD